MLFSQLRIAAALALAGTLALGACSFPGSKEITAFSDGTTAVSQLAKSAAVLDVELDGKTKAGSRAILYASGGPGSAVDFPPPTGVLIGGKADKDWAVRIEVLNKMIAYANAIKSVSDPSQGTQVKDALSGLSLALTDFASASAARINDPNQKAAALAETQRIQAAGELIAVVAGYAVNAYAAFEIRRVMRDVHPALDEIVQILRLDFTDLAASIHRKTGLYTVVVRKKLAAYAGDPQLSKAQKHDLYLAATAEIGALRERVEVVQDFPKLLEKLIKAHAELKDNIDGKAELLAFLALVQDLAAKIKKFQDVERSLKS